MIEFAFGLNPKDGGSVSLPPPVLAGGNLTAGFPTPAGVTGITYGAEWSTTLESGSWTAIPDTGAGTSHVFQVPVGANTRLFMRYLVTEP